MADNTKPQHLNTTQNAPKGQTVVHPTPHTAHAKHLPKGNPNANPAGQGNEGDNVMMAGRETSG